MDQLESRYRTIDLIKGPLLKDRFVGLWRGCAAPRRRSSDAEAVWRELERHYSEPHRHYHDKRHLAYCLAQLDLVTDIVEHPKQVETAIWFHDLINHPASTDNERRSADQFRELAVGAMEADFIDAVEKLILATTHRGSPKEKDQQFICDIDLASFGCPWECFMQDSTAVKAEFIGTDEEYYQGKTAFLHAMLRRGKIFLTDFFNARYERQARENIQRLLRLIEHRAD